MALASSGHGASCAEERGNMVEEEVVDGRACSAAEEGPLTPAWALPAPEPRLAWGAALAASALLAACGGGGGEGSGDGTAAPPADSAGSLAPLSGSQSDAEAARFLLQAQGYATEADIKAVLAQGFLPWLAAQFDASKSETGWDWFNARASVSGVDFDNMVWAQLMASPDGMRKRLALALSEIFVVSGSEIDSSWTDHMMAQYWDTLVAGVTGNFRSLLEAISLN